MVNNKKLRGRERRAQREERAQREDRAQKREYHLEVLPQEGVEMLEYNNNELQEFADQAYPDMMRRRQRQYELTYARRAWARQILERRLPAVFRNRQVPNMVPDAYWENHYWEGSEKYMDEHPDRVEVEVFSNYFHPDSRWDYYVLRIDNQYVRLTLLNDEPYF